MNRNAPAWWRFMSQRGAVNITTDICSTSLSWILHPWRYWQLLVPRPDFISTDLMVFIHSLCKILPRNLVRLNTSQEKPCEPNPVGSLVLQRKLYSYSIVITLQCHKFNFHHLFIIFHRSKFYSSNILCSHFSPDDEGFISMEELLASTTKLKL